MAIDDKLTVTGDSGKLCAGIVVDNRVWHLYHDESNSVSLDHVRHTEFNTREDLDADEDKLRLSYPIIRVGEIVMAFGEPAVIQEIGRHTVKVRLANGTVRQDLRSRIKLRDDKIAYPLLTKGYTLYGVKMKINGRIVCNDSLVNGKFRNIDNGTVIDMVSTIEAAEEAVEKTRAAYLSVDVGHQIYYADNGVVKNGIVKTLDIDAVLLDDEFKTVVLRSQITATQCSVFTPLVDGIFTDDGGYLRLASFSRFAQRYVGYNPGGGYCISTIRTRLYREQQITAIQQIRSWAAYSIKVGDTVSFGEFVNNGTHKVIEKKNIDTLVCADHEGFQFEAPVCLATLVRPKDDFDWGAFKSDGILRYRAGTFDKFISLKGEKVCITPLKPKPMSEEDCKKALRKFRDKYRAVGVGDRCRLWYYDNSVSYEIVHVDTDEVLVKRLSNEFVTLRVNRSLINVDNKLPKLEFELVNDKVYIKLPNGHHKQVFRSIEEAKKWVSDESAKYYRPELWSDVRLVTTGTRNVVVDMVDNFVDLYCPDSARRIGWVHLSSISQIVPVNVVRERTPMLRKSLYAVGGLVATCLTIWLTPVDDYASVAYHKMCGWTTDSIPVSWDLETARSAVKQLSQEIKGHKVKVAKTEVEVERINHELQSLRGRVNEQKVSLVAMRNLIKPDSQIVKVSLSRGGEVELGVDEAKAMLQAEFQNLRTNMDTISNMEKALATKRLRVVQANRSLDAAIAQRAMMESEIEALATRVNSVEAENLGVAEIDTSSFVKCRDLLSKVNERVSIQEKLGGSFGPVSAFKIPEAESNKEITAAIDDFLATNK